jgi:hypothetical protein
MNKKPIKKIKTMSAAERAERRMKDIGPVSARKGPVPARKRAKNNSLTIHSACWNNRFEDLREFYRKENHSDVPSPFPENPGLSGWVKRQRWEYALFTAGDLSARAMTPDRVVRLMTVNFTWSLHKRSWENSYSALLNSKEKYGHTNVPYDFKDYWHWANGSDIRDFRSEGTLARKKVALRLTKCNGCTTLAFPAIRL